MKNIIRDARGFSHEIILVMLVVIIGIGGSAYLVISHADSCTTPVSNSQSDVSDVSDVSGSGCDPTSDVSTPVTPPVQPPPPPATVAAGTCSIRAVPANNVARGKSMQFLTTVKNTGTASFTPSVHEAVYTYTSGQLRLASNSTLKSSSLVPRQSRVLTYDKAFKVPTNKATNRGYLLATSTNPKFSCRVDFSFAK